MTPRASLIPLLSFILTLILTLPLEAQDCYHAAWVKDFGGNSAYQGVVDGDRLPDGRFVIAGSFTNASLNLGSITLPADYAYNYYLAIHDSAGNFSAAAVIASGGTIEKVITGGDGSIYVTGEWTGSIVLGNVTLPNTTRYRVFVAKFSPDLQMVWHRGSDHMAADCFSYDVATDLEKNVYICGTFEDNAFKMGEFEADNAGGWNMWSNDAFVAKFDSNGNTQYLFSLGGIYDDAARTITADSLGNIFVTGSTAKCPGWIRFDEQVALPSGVPDNSMFLVKYEGVSGHALWAKMLGGLTTYDRLFPYNACLGDNNSLIIAGSITGTISCPPHFYTAADQNAFLARFDNNGNNEWLQQTGGQNSSEYGYYCFYNNGRIATTGRLFSNRTYCANFPLYATMTNGTCETYNAMFESSGKLIWARANDPSNYSDFYPSIAFIDAEGNQLYWGSYKSTQVWYPITKTNSSSYVKTFLAKFIPFSPAPVFTVSAGPDKTTTCGTLVQLQASTTPTSMPFGWYPDLGFSSNGSKTPNVNPGKPQSYIFFATYQGCVKSDTTFVDVTNYNGFFIDAGPDLDFCSGDSVQITTNSNQTGLTYAWLPQKFINTATSANPWVKPVLPTQYVVTANYNGCLATDTISIVQHNKPYIYLPKQDQYYSWIRYHICEGTPVEVNMGDPANTYTVLTPSLTSSINNNLITLNGNYPGGPLKVEATSPYGCYNKDSVNIIIHNNQAAPVILGSVPDRTACPGDSIKIIVWLTNSIQYNFQYSWYGGWQVDSMNGSGWKDISTFDFEYQVTNYSVGDPTSTYYTRLVIPTIDSGMDGFRFRCYVSDYCSPRVYSNAGTLHTGPKITQQPVSVKMLCQNATDSVFVNSSSANVQYQWELWQNGSWTPLVEQPGVITSNGRFLRFQQAQPALDSTLVRCTLSGCNGSAPVNSNTSLIRVVPVPSVVWQTHYDTVCPGTPDSLMVIPNSDFFTLNWYANNVAMTGNTSQLSGYNTNKLKFNPVMMAQTNVDYKLKMTYSQCAFSAYSDTTGFIVIQVPAVSWTGNMITTCINAAPITLSGATPAGGTYSGPGVVGGVFYPSLAGLGSFILSYSVSSSTPGCNGTALHSVWVQDLPTVSWPGNNMQFCTNSNNYYLTGGSPSFGTYSGPGVSGNWFNPASAGPGVHTITYSYTYPTTGCTNSATRTFTVGTQPNVSWPGGTHYLCLSSPALLLTGGIPSGGTYFGTGVNGNFFDPMLSGTGSFNISYSYEDPLVSSCQGSTSRSFVVNPDPFATWPGGQLNYCIDDLPDSCFGALPTGGTYSGNGVSNNMFYPQVAGLGFHTITYTYIHPLDSCQDEVTRTYYVDGCVGMDEATSEPVKVHLQQGNLLLEFPAELTEAARLSLYTLLGQEIHHNTIPQGSTTFYTTVYPGAFTMAVLRLSGSWGTRVIKLVNNH